MKYGKQIVWSSHSKIIKARKKVLMNSNPKHFQWLLSLKWKALLWMNKYVNSSLLVFYSLLARGNTVQKSVCFLFNV